MSALRDSTTPSLLKDNKMVQEALTITEYHDYLSLIAMGLEVHPENQIMLQQYQNWSRIAAKETMKFQKKWGKFPVSVVEEIL